MFTFEYSDEFVCDPLGAEYLMEVFAGDVVVLTHEVSDRLNQINEIQPGLGFLCLLSRIGLKQSAHQLRYCHRLDSIHLA